MMETYAERLQDRKGNTMTNYDMDEIERQKERERRSRGIRPEDNEKPWKYNHDKCTEEIEFDIGHDTLISLALKAHEEEITLNHLMNKILQDKIKDFEYQFENGTKPELLKEY
jgi:hypothetical protein